MELDRMHMLVPRGVLEWKNELLNQMIKGKMTQLNNMLGNVDAETEQAILLEIQTLMQKRGELAKAIGDRTIGKKIKGM